MAMWLAVDRMVTRPPDSQTPVCRSTLVLEDNCHPLDFKKITKKKGQQSKHAQVVILPRCLDSFLVNIL